MVELMAYSLGPLPWSLWPFATTKNTRPSI